MRSDASLFALQAPASLDEALALLAAAPGAHLPIAGGTELMVAFNTGRLTQRSLLSLHKLDELRFIRENEGRIEIGARTTFTDLRESAIVTDSLPLLARAASWTGAIANQNRATLGGNLCNASPAADSAPALLVYDAALTLVSTTGRRTVPYQDFHLGYKKTAIRPDELLFSVTFPRVEARAQQYIRKVGTRNAQAISKVALAAVGYADNGIIAGVRVAAASLADRPLRLFAVEESLLGKPVQEETIRAARAALAHESTPIDDIRSTAPYRTAVAANLLEEFLRTLM